MSISNPRDYTPERIILEIKKTIMENPYVQYFEIRKEIAPDSVPTIFIELELYEKQIDRKLALDEMLEQSKKIREGIAK